MGVMACDRNGCDHVLCEHYSSTYGYICWECLDELKSKVPDVTINEFMASPKKGDVTVRDVMREHALMVIEREFTVD